MRFQVRKLAKITGMCRSSGCFTQFITVLDMFLVPIYGSGSLFAEQPLRLEAVYFGHLTGLAQDQQFVRLWAQQRAVGEDILSVDLHQAVKGFKLKLLMSQARVGVEECARERPGLAS